ncbi:uncharacterized protein LOC129915707 isoform X1 [Episyrphus balteatus]|uniref:uncharacterized protein LOC129915707 isoform X1 n=1 Tax=Episyrphus balteatus TaxID=286459 RepID=UPI002486326A|nr:uncharacterized protein LOC129915707 isoform X1 [Episyrphus balteatus]
MCDMPIPFGAEFDPSGPGSFEIQPPPSSSRDNEIPQSSKSIDPIRSAYVPRYTQTNIPAPLYHPPRKSPQASESLQTFSYYPNQFPQQQYYYTGPSSNSQSLHQFYGSQQHPQQFQNNQYQPVDQFPAFHQNSGMVDPRIANGSYASVRRQSHGTCEKCGSINSSNGGGYYPNYMPMVNSEPLQRFSEVGGNQELIAPSRPYRFYYPPNPSNRKNREHILF